MSDLISRQAAIDTCMRKDVRTGYDGACLIAQLPSAQPEIEQAYKQGWDDCRKALEEEQWEYVRERFD